MLTESTKLAGRVVEGEAGPGGCGLCLGERLGEDGEAEEGSGGGARRGGGRVGRRRDWRRGQLGRARLGDRKSVV